MSVVEKHIVVTCNYVARSFGIGKLGLISDAVKLCPGLVIIDGSDITPYRRASRRIFQFVKTLLNGSDADDVGNNWDVKMEKLGMDELFLDVGGVVGRHLDSVGDGDERGEMVFEVDSSHRFGYKVGTWVGKMVGDANVKEWEEKRRQLVYLQVATHLAAYIREMIYEELGYTTSAGVAHNKLLAKLVGEVKKPDGQSVFIAGREGGEWFGRFGVGKIPGVGREVRRVLCGELERVLGDGAEVADEVGDGARGVGMSDGESDSLEESELPSSASSQPTVALVHSLIPLPTLINLLGPTLAPTIHSLLHGHDPSPVIPSTLPTQISIEDSFPHCTSIPELRCRLLHLTTRFIYRLQEEEWDEESGWKRVARVVRLSIRRRTPEGGRSSGSERESKSTQMPVEVWDVKTDIEERTRGLVEVLMRVFGKMVGGGRFDLSLVNVAAVEWRREGWTGIRGFLVDKGESGEGSREMINGGSRIEEGEIDMSVLNELPEEIREEILRDRDARFGAREDDTNRKRSTAQHDLPTAKKKRGEQGKKRKDGSLVRLWANSQSKAESSSSVAVEGEIRGESNGDEGCANEGFVCPKCGVELFVWCVEAHVRFHDAEG